MQLRRTIKPFNFDVFDLEANDLLSILKSSAFDINKKCEVFYKKVVKMQSDRVFNIPILEKGYFESVDDYLDRCYKVAGFRKLKLKGGTDA